MNVLTEMQFWALLMAVLVGVLALSVLMNRYLNHLENRVPEWVKPYLPPAYQTLSGLWEQGMSELRDQAEETAVPYDDELVEITDQQGQRLLVKIVRVLGYEPDAGD